MNKIRVLVVDDHEIVRLGLTHFIEQYPDMEVVDGANSLGEALLKTEQHNPDVIIMDIRLKKSSGIDACREITNCFPQTKIIMLTSYCDEEMLVDSIMAGAKGYVLKDVGNDEIIRAVRAAYRGESLLDSVVTNKLLNQMRTNGNKQNDSLDLLSVQEKKVLALIAKGKTNKEIADEVFLSEKTVRNYVSNILAKLNLSNRTEAAAYAAKRNLSNQS
ncbi:MAG: response regulator transcription factor [Thermincola sp.]|jgi:DNA-binding NarL/FixJ family response regulator|nr:response regulator transcription factor [Thermincola sp.]MDT3703839.1 response regulator transcription factor [Thermincola sp.]